MNCRSLLAQWSRDPLANYRKPSVYGCAGQRNCPPHRPTGSVWSHNRGYAQVVGLLEIHMAGACTQVDPETAKNHYKVRRRWRKSLRSRRDAACPPAVVGAGKASEFCKKASNLRNRFFSSSFLEYNEKCNVKLFAGNCVGKFLQRDVRNVRPTGDRHFKVEPLIVEHAGRETTVDTAVLSGSS